ncbi:MAG: hypothetical protein R3D84_12105 [Paracoccaceae bacterium]
MAAAIAQVSQLDSKGLAELIVSMSEKISDQQTENDALKKAAERANQGLTLWKLATTLFGVVLAFAGAVLWFGRLWGTGRRCAMLMPLSRPTAR